MTGKNELTTQPPNRGSTLESRPFLSPRLLNDSELKKKNGCVDPRTGSPKPTTADDDFGRSVLRRVRMKSWNLLSSLKYVWKANPVPLHCPAPDSRASELGRAQFSKTVGVGTPVRVGACPHPTGFILLLLLMRALQL